MRVAETEVLDVVDIHNAAIGVATLDQVYRHKLPHRIVHVLVVDSDGSAVYLQRRAMTKSFLPGYYCTSAGGHVQAGETYLQAAARELREELGIEAPLAELDAFTFDSDGHTRFVTLFLARADGGFSFVDKEVMDGVFVSFAEAAHLIKTEEKVHPQLRACFDRLVQKGTFAFSPF